MSYTASAFCPVSKVPVELPNGQIVSSTTANGSKISKERTQAAFTITFLPWTLPGPNIRTTSNSVTSEFIEEVKFKASYMGEISFGYSAILMTAHESCVRVGN